jgi:hypothetical protein
MLHRVIAINYITREGTLEVAAGKQEGDPY